MRHAPLAEKKRFAPLNNTQPSDLFDTIPSEYVFMDEFFTCLMHFYYYFSLFAIGNKIGRCHNTGTLWKTFVAQLYYFFIFLANTIILMDTQKITFYFVEVPALYISFPWRFFLTNFRPICILEGGTCLPNGISSLLLLLFIPQKHESTEK